MERAPRILCAMSPSVGQLTSLSAVTYCESNTEPRSRPFDLMGHYFGITGGGEKQISDPS